MTSHNNSHIPSDYTGHRLILRNVSVSYGRTQALRSVDLNASEGEILGLVGPNGAGKTTLLRAISGLVKVREGTIALDGVICSGFSATRIARLGIGHMFQDLRLFSNASILDNVLLGFPTQYGERAMQAIWSPSRTEEREKFNSQAALLILERLGIRSSPEITAASLSYGDQKLLALARLLAMNPHVLLIDEIAAGLSLPLRNQIATLIRELGRGKVVILSEHDLMLVAETCTRICVLRQGCISLDVHPQEILGTDQLRRLLYGA
jgi:ABC-type branched-subunit amino acid transport system ATPase component